MKKTGFYFVYLFSLILIISSCGSADNKELFKHKETLNMDNGMFNQNTIIEGADAHSGKKFSRTDIGNNYGIGYSYLIPDTLKGKNIFVNLDSWVRTGDLSNNCDIALTLTRGDSVLLWTGFNVREFMKAPNEWSRVNRTIELPVDLISKDKVVINVMAHNIDAKSFFDVDDMNINYFEAEPKK